MKKQLIASLCLGMLASCSGDGPGEDVVKDIYLKRIKNLETSSIKISSFDIEEETLLKNRSLKDPLDNVRMRYKMSLSLVASEDCKLNIEEVPSGYESRGLRVVATGPYFQVYNCLSENNFQKLLAKEKEQLEAKIGKTNHKSCSSFSMACRPRVFTKEEIAKQFETRKAELLSKYNRTVKKGEEVFSGKQKLVINSGKGGNDTKNWKIEKIANI